MRRIWLIALDVLCGLALAAVEALGVTVLLQSTSLVYLLFPLPGVLALLFGWWRGGASSLNGWLLAVLLCLPSFALGAMAATEGAATFLAVPIMVALCVGVAIALARRPAEPLRWTVVVVAFVAVQIGVAFALPRFVSSLIVSREVNEPSPAFQVALLGGGMVNSADLRGKVAVIDFWTSWCVPCRREFPELERLAERYAGRADLKFLAIDGARRDTVEQAKKFLADNHYRMPAAFDQGSVAYEAFGETGFPTLLVLDRSGRIRFRHVGYIGSEDLPRKLTAVLDRLLAAPT